MRVMTVLGTRPEIIRLSEVIRILDGACDHVLVHTGQNYDARLKGLFFQELGVRQPDVELDIRASTVGGQVGQILEQCEWVFVERHPERLLILGDTNSGLCAIVARRLGIPVYHMEAGNRCGDDRVPEEINRRVIDHCSTVLLPYTHRSKENLLAEGIPLDRIFVTGNPIREVLLRHEPAINASQALETLGVNERRYFLVTLHRAENVDEPLRLRRLVTTLEKLGAEHDVAVVMSTHPRTQARLTSGGLTSSVVRFMEPFGFFDFVRLERSALCVLSDSGTVQEEACLLGVPNVTLRDVTERPETVECGSNLLGGSEPEIIGSLVRLALNTDPASWSAPADYLVSNVAQTVANILLSYRTPTLGEAAWYAKA